MNLVVAIRYNLVVVVRDFCLFRRFSTHLFLPSFEPKMQHSFFKLIHNSYDQILRILSKLEISKVNGILLDLGISSLQLNSEDRGFSFSRPAPLDMRFDRTNRRTAADVLNKLSEPELSDVFYRPFFLRRQDLLPLP